MCPSVEPVPCAVVGYGWRSKVFIDLASRLPSLELAGIVTRKEEAAEEAARDWRVPTYTSLERLLEQDDIGFVVVCVPRTAAPDLIRQCVSREVPVLAETPPAADAEALRALWRDVGTSELVQVAEQYPSYPGHLARQAIVRRGLIGDVTAVHVSSTHGYHAMALVRAFLGGTFASARVCGRSFSSLLSNPITREGWAGDLAPQPSETIIATLDFGGSMGLYDFSSNQWHNRLRHRRLLVRGTSGEIADDSVVWLTGGRTLPVSTLLRRQSGLDLDLEGFDTQEIFLNGEVLYRNPLEGLRLADDEIAVGSLMVKMAAWCQGSGAPPYTLAHASQDQILALAVAESVSTGQDVVTRVEPWAP